LQSNRQFLVNMLLDYNHAWTGGTVYWVCIPEYDPLDVGDSSNVWGEHNRALYGNKTATQGIKLIGPTNYQVTVYGKPLDPPLEYYLLDYYDQLIPFADEVTTVSVSLNEQNASCFGVHPYLAGANTIGAGVVINENGYAIF
jgi:hypothetical protein